MNYSDARGMEPSSYLTLPMCEKRINAETVGEITLPDYQPEIRRVLAVMPTVLPPAKYVGGSGVEISGTVDYSVLYVGADGELYTLPMSSEYHVSLPVEGMSEFDPGAGVTLWADVTAENCSFRVTSPRKMSVRCRLRALLRAFGRILMEEKLEGECRNDLLFRRTETAKTLLLGGGSSEVVTLSCEFSGLGEDARVISADATPILTVGRTAGETAYPSGEVTVKLLVGREGSTPTVVSRSLPLSGEVELELANPEQCRATGTVSDISIEMSEDGRILCEVSVILEVRGMKECEVAYTADLFSGECESECEIVSYRLPVALGCTHGNFSQSERIPTAEISLQEGCSIVDVWGSVLFDLCEKSGQRYLLSGESRYTLLCERDGELFCSEVSVPIRYETEGGEQAPESYSAKGTVLSCRARLDGEMLALDAEIDVVTDLIGFEEVSAVRSVRFTAPCAARQSRMTVYYPADGEDAWSVAKKYHISPEKIQKGKSYFYF